MATTLVEGQHDVLFRRRARGGGELHVFFAGVKRQPFRQRAVGPDLREKILHIGMA